MKIYTKTGDNGTTGLFAGPRVPKDHPRIQAYGAVDELNALLGVVLAALPTQTQTDEFDTPEILQQIQSDLFSIGAQLATPHPSEHGMCLLSDARVEELERYIDVLDGKLEPLSNFILPSGCMASSMVHLARTVCRRAERDIVSLSHNDSVENPERLIVYLNRLSDFLFVLARWVNHVSGISDVAWIRPEQG